MPLDLTEFEQALHPHSGAILTQITPTGTTHQTLGHGLTPTTPLEIGSLTKVFTGLLFASALLRQELTADTRLDQHLFRTSWPGNPITLTSLATHTSGLPRLSLSPLRGAFGDPYRDIHRSHLSRWLLRHKPTLPGQPSFAYSNFGYAVLGLALEAATGQTYAQLLQERILGPLRLTGTVLQLTGGPTLVAHGRNSRGRVMRPWHHDAYAPAGGLVSTAEDMVSVLQAFLDSSSPIASALHLATQSRTAIPGGTIGLALLSPANQVWHWHNGATFGYASYLGFDLTRGTAVSLLCNQSLPGPLTSLGHALMRA